MATKALQLRTPGINAQKFDAVVVGFLLCFGLYLPTSIGGDASKMLFGIAYLACLVLFLGLIYRAVGLPSFPVCLSLLSIAPLLLVFTYTSGFHEYSFGELAAFGLLSILYMMNLRRIVFPRWLSHLFVIVNSLNILLGIEILVGSESVKGFLIAHYSSFYAELVPNMLLLRKPVLTFATHSLAGFFFYLFFYINLQTNKLKGKKLFLFFAVCYLFLTAALLSVTGVALAFVGTVQICYHLWSSIRHKWFWVPATLVIICLVASFQRLDSAARNWSDFVEAGKAILMSTNNGFIGRVMPGGPVYDSFEYLKEHPFSPIGAGVKEGMVVADMGLSDYLLRGSFILAIFAYAGLFYFLKRSLLARSDFRFLFGIIVVFELGFSTLTYFRMLYLLPFFVVYLNGLRRDEVPSDVIIPRKGAVQR